MEKLLINNGFKIEIDKLKDEHFYSFLDSEWLSFLSNVTVEIFKSEKNIVYKDEAEILSIANEVLRKQIYMYKRQGTLVNLGEKHVGADDYLEYLIRELKSVDGTKKIITFICKNQIGINVNEDRFTKTIEVFQSMVTELGNIQTNYKKINKVMIPILIPI